MNGSRKKEYYKHFLKEFLLDYGLMNDPKKNLHCINPDHEDVHPSACFYEDRNVVTCFACGKSYDIYDAIGFQFGLTSFNEQIQKAEELYGPVPDSYEQSVLNQKAVKEEKVTTEKAFVKVDQSAFFEEANKSLNEHGDECMEYLASRGITIDTANRFNLGHCLSEQYPPNQLVIPTGKYTYNIRAISDDTKQKYYRPKGMPVILFNEDALHQKRYPVFVVEGEIDAISIEELGYPSVALESASNIGLISERDDLNELEYPLIVALDNDDTGKKKSNDLCSRLEKKGVQYVTLGTLYGDYKDANECLIHEPDQFKKRLESAIMLSLDMAQDVLDKQKEALEEYKSQSVKSHKDVYVKDRMLQLDPISTGYPNLDEVLNGGLQPGRVYTIGAISSLGKTTFFNQMAEYVSSKNTDVIYYTLEMSEAELNSKGISRNTYRICISNLDSLNATDAKTSHEVDSFWRKQFEYSEKDKKIIKYATDDYFNNGEHLYIHDDVITIDDIVRDVTNHIKITSELPVVFIDYLQIIPPSESEKGLSDKARMDSIVLRLKDISRKYNIPIVVISSFNRQNYGQQANMTAFKESGSIEYSSDVVIALEFSALSDDETSYNEVVERSKAIRNVDVVVLKNRNGQSGARIHYAFYTKYNYYYEK